MLGDPRSHGLWEKTAPAAPPSTALTGDHTADAVVVGGGYTGLSTALQLAEAGVRVILLEAAESGFGGAARNVRPVDGGGRKGCCVGLKGSVRLYLAVGVT